MVTVSSTGHHIRGAIHFDDLHFERWYGRAASYRYLERELGIGEWVLLTLIAAAVASRVWWVRRRAARR